MVANPRPRRGAAFPTFAKARNTVQLIHGALMGGLLTFCAIVEATRSQVTPAEIDAAILVPVGAVVSLSCIALALALPIILASRVHSLSPGARLRAVVATRTVMCAALEGAGLLWAVFALMLAERSYLLGSVVTLVLLGVLFPTQSRLEEMMDMGEDQIDRALKDEPDPDARPAQDAR